MKKLLLIVSASLLLVGAGCAADPNASSATNPPPGLSDKGTTQGDLQKSATATEREKGQQGAAMESATASAQRAAHAKASVLVTAGGTFSPAVIAIKVGDTVTWTNKAADPVQIASNPHPTHTDYPGFDSLSAIDQGKTYSFTFTKAGSWGYHNHFSPTVQGTVIVTE